MCGELIQQLIVLTIAGKGNKSYANAMILPAFKRVYWLLPPFPLGIFSLKV